MQGLPRPGAFDSNQECSQFVFEQPDNDRFEVCLPNVPALLHAITTDEELDTIISACPAPSPAASEYIRRLHGVAANIVHEPFLRLLGLASTIAQSGGGGRAPPVVNDALLLGVLQNALPPPFDCYMQQLIPMNKVAPYYPAMQCLVIQEEQSCTANSDCSWGAPLMPGRCSPKIASVVGDECALHGAAVCLDQNEASCGSQSQCAWTTPAGSCEESEEEATCGAQSHSNESAAQCATQSGCEWDGDYCNPTHVCNSQTDEATCGAQPWPHCTWRLGNPFCNVKLASLVEMLAGDFSSGGALSLTAAGSFAAMQCQSTPTAECSSVSYDTLPASAAALLQSLPADENAGVAENNDTDSSDSSNNNMGMMVGGGLVAVLVVGGVVFLSGVCAQEKHDETHGMEMGSRA